MTGLKPIAEIMSRISLQFASTTSPTNSPRALYVERPGQMPAGDTHRQWRRLPLRRPAQPERRELVHDDSRLSVAPSSPVDVIGLLAASVPIRSGDLPRAQILYATKGEVPDARS